MRALCPIFGQQPRLWRDFVQKFAYRERVPDLYALIGQARHENGWRQQQDFGARVRVVWRHDHLVEVDSGELRHQPAAQRTRRIVLAAQRQRRSRHGSASGIRPRPREQAPCQWHVLCLTFEQDRRARAMMYDAYQAVADVGDRVRLLSANAEAILNCWSSRPWASPLARMAAYYEVVALAGFTHDRPDYGVDSVEVRGETRAVTQSGAMRTPFCQL